MLKEDKNQNIVKENLPVLKKVNPGNIYHNTLNTNNETAEFQKLYMFPEVGKVNCKPFSNSNIFIYLLLLYFRRCLHYSFLA